MPGYDADTMKALYAALRTEEGLSYAMDADARAKGISPADLKSIRASGFSARFQADQLITLCKGLFGADLHAASAPATPATSVPATPATSAPATPATSAPAPTMATAIKAALKGKKAKTA